MVPDDHEDYILRPVKWRGKRTVRRPLFPQLIYGDSHVLFRYGQSTTGPKGKTNAFPSFLKVSNGAGHSIEPNKKAI